MAARKTLREWRAFYRLNKTDVARHLNVHPNTYARLEEDPSSMTLSMAAALAKLFRCQADAIIFFEANPNTVLDLGEHSRTVYGEGESCGGDFVKAGTDD